MVGKGISLQLGQQQGPPVVPLALFFGGGGFPYKKDYRKQGTLILTSLLEDLGNQEQQCNVQSQERFSRCGLKLQEAAFRFTLGIYGADSVGTPRTETPLVTLGASTVAHDHRATASLISTFLKLSEKSSNC